jgi:hypothetical protein
MAPAGRVDGQRLGGVVRGGGHRGGELIVARRAAPREVRIGPQTRGSRRDARGDPRLLGGKGLRRNCSAERATLVILDGVDKGIAACRPAAVFNADRRLC